MLALAVFAMEIVVVGVVLGTLLGHLFFVPYVFFAVLFLEGAFGAVWFIVVRYILKKRFGVVLPLIRRY